MFDLNSVFIDKFFIKVFNQNEVLLKINPVTELVGVMVYDSSGRRLGKIRKVLRNDNKNNFKSLVVKNKFYSKPVLVERGQIEIMRKNVILNVESLKQGNGRKKRTR